jgi:NitT/TauT family transport system substrate-binding protein
MINPMRPPVLLAAFAALAFLGGCDERQPVSFETAQGGAAQPELAKVRLQLNWVAEPEFGGFYAAHEKAIYASEGLDVEVIQGSADIPAPQLAASGKVEFATIAATQLVELNAQGGDLVALYAVYQTNPMGVMVHESSPFATIEDLWRSDAKLAISEGLADYDWLKKSFPSGPRTVIPYNGSNAQFAADPTLASQCFVPSEPTALALQGVKTRVFMISDTGFNPYNTVVVTTRPYFERNRELCARFVKATALGWRAYLNDPKSTNQSMARLNPAMSSEMMDKVCEVQLPLIQNDETKRLGLGGMLYARWDELVKQLGEMGKLRTPLDPQSLFFWDSGSGTAR